VQQWVCVFYSGVGNLTQTFEAGIILIEFLGLIVAIAGVYIAYLAYRHQKRLAKPAEVDTQPASLTPPKSASWDHEIPDGITFGDKIILIPGLQARLFTHSGRIVDDLWWKRQYTWIARGEPIGRYETLDPSAGGLFSDGKWVGADVLAPVSGLVVHPSYGDFSDWPKSKNGEAVRPIRAQFAILIADNEPGPEGNAFMFDSILRFIDRYRAPLFKPSKQWTMEGMTDADYQRLVGLQRDAHCIEVDAMPEFHDYFEEARKLHPTLRPYLAHLR